LIRRAGPALLLLWACPRAGVPQGSASAPPPPVFAVPQAFARVCDQVAGAGCDWRIRCGLLAPADRPACVAAARCNAGRVQAAAAAGEIAMDPDAGAACAADLMQAPCDLLSDFASCESVFVGLEDAGQPCLAKEACGPGNFCLVGTACPPTCAAYAQAGEPCGPGAPCDPHAICAASPPTCQSHPPLFGPCRTDKDCFFSETCQFDGGSGHCALNYLFVDAGDPCDLLIPVHVPDGGPERLCVYPDACSQAADAGPAICVPPAMTGAPCTPFVTNCLSPEGCNPLEDGGFACEPPSAPGAACTSSFAACQDFYTCEPDGLCERTPGVGEPCDAGTILCGEGICDETTSVCALLPEGSPCLSDTDCASGFCDAFGAPGQGAPVCLPSCW
jgi:hypothetical protein